MSAQRKTFIAVALAAATAIAGIALQLAAHEHSKSVSEARARSGQTQAAAAASRDFPAFADFTPSSVAVNSNRAKAVLSPGFKRTYDSDYGGDLTAALAAGAAVENDVVDAQPIRSSSDGSLIQVLVFVTERVTSSKGMNATVQPAQYQMTMKLVGARWLIDSVSSLTPATG